METDKAIFKNAWPYQQDKMNLPVKDVQTSIPFYETIMGFRVVSKRSEPPKMAVLERDNVQIGLTENGGDPTQDGCFIEVDNVTAALEELRSNELDKEVSGFSTQKHGQTSWKVFFVVAPDGLCYCIGEKQN